MRRLPSATRRWRKITACSTCYTNCSACNLAGVRRSSIADQLALAFEDVEQAVAATEAADDKKNPAAAKVAPTSAGPIAVRFPPICRACM